MFTLDDTDFLILKYLQQDGRMTMRDLAAKISMSPPAAAERVRRLEDAGIIAGYRAEINASRLGFEINGYMVATPLLTHREAFYSYIMERDEILSCETVLSGGPEAMLKICCRSASHLMKLHEGFFGIANTTTYLVADQVIKSAPVNPRLGRAAEDEPEGYELLRNIKGKRGNA